LIARNNRDSSRVSETLRADSESQFLAIKKFSCFARRALIASRQNQISERIAATDSLSGFARAMRHYETHDRREDAAPSAARRSDAELALE
jgi:hypothetical protein